MASLIATGAAQPQVFSIQHFCVHDGPGIRSVVFLKGCPLRCSWCQNPESWSLAPELGHKARQCIGCGTCVKTCTTGAMRAPGDWSLEDCTQCFRCVDTCPGGALTRFGEPRGVADVLRELAVEFPLYRQSGGGVTLSGGEAMLFPEYVADMGGALRDAGVHVAVETCGLFRLHEGSPDTLLAADEKTWARFARQPAWRALASLDLVLFDLKILDRARHREHCGADNRRILANFRLLAALAQAGRGPAVWPRLPLVPGITDDEDNVRGIARFVRGCGIGAVTLLPYHNLGVDKFRWLRREATFSAAQLPEDSLTRARRILEEEGLRWFASGDEDYAAANAETAKVPRTMPSTYLQRSNAP
jgi:glycyl-radical enzyme activating protein